MSNLASNKVSPNTGQIRNEVNVALKAMKQQTTVELLVKNSTKHDLQREIKPQQNRSNAVKSFNNHLSFPFIDYRSDTSKD